jgi:hypothetical protein
MVRAGVLAMAAAVTIVVAGSWLHATASAPKRVAHAPIDVLSLTLAKKPFLPVQSFNAI